MKTLIVVVWLLFGLVAIWREYHTSLKEFYQTFGESIWDKDNRKLIGAPAVYSLIISIPFMLLGGPIAFIIFECSDFKTRQRVWYFTTKNKSK
jgi:hypothetical protein